LILDIVGVESKSKKIFAMVSENDNKGISITFKFGKINQNQA
jgi:hypothetical protein